MSYTLNEAALRDLIAANITGYTAHIPNTQLGNCSCGNVDIAFKYAVANNKNVCILDPFGATNDGQPNAFGAHENILWGVSVSFFLLYDQNTIETDIRTLKDDFTAMHNNNKRLSTGFIWRIREEREFKPQANKYSNRPYVPMVWLAQIKEQL
jgi:hypothetical protein